ncbi:uncharacterized protein LOC115742076 isoform X2 [Rhodamnia argentea]|uniref:Uncharacterized protein LOC115742076 isoform X2 n=1 Tax=Rhodamnia argentea TaxID=178133 RepID=A0ABM3GV06_9MYRT|nr:uncharacterized protein LOC115742076 isoform X2 [Rhodamnia argentea]
MRRQEKKRKFHEAVLNMLYPPPPSPPSPQEEDGDGARGGASGGLQGDRIPDEGGNEVGGSSASDVDPEDNEGECGEQKLTRAQRKRIRKKKLKEEIAHRRKIVGPLLPSSSSGGCSTKEDDAGGVEEKEAPGVRRNAELGSDDVPHDREESAAFINQKRLKHRRAAKKLARDRLKSSEQQNSN